MKAGQASPRAVGDHIILGSTLALAIAVIASATYRARFGFDLSDESFYLLWITDPDRYTASSSQFGFVLHPLSVFAGENVVAWRVVNTLVLVLLAAVLAARVLRESGVADRGLAGLSLSVGLAIPSLLITGLVSATPNYNSANLCALLVLAIGVTLVRARMRASSAVGWVLIGLGGWCALLVKPTSALVAGLLAVFTLAWMRRVGWHGVAVILVVAPVLLLATGAAMGGTAADLVSRFAAGAEDSGVLDPRHSALGAARWALHSIFSWASIPARVVWVCALGLAVVVGAATWLALRPATRHRRWLASALLAVVIAFVVLTGWAPAWSTVTAAPYLILGPCIAAVGVALAVARRGEVRGWGGSARQRTGVALFLGLVPVAFAAGTNNQFVPAALLAGVFLILGAAMALGSVVGAWGATRGWRQDRMAVALAPLALGGILVTAIVLNTAVVKPYRQPSLAQGGGVAVAVPLGGAQLVLAGPVAGYVAALRDSAVAAGFREGTSFVDLTGQTPGAALLIGGAPIGRPWLIGGYPGSESLAGMTLGRADCAELGQAWVLVEPGGRRAIPAGVLSAQGLDIDEDFVVVADLTTWDSRKQQLLAPRDPRAGTASCQAARGLQ